MKRTILLALVSGALSIPLFSQNFNFELRSQFSFPDEDIAGVWGYEKDGREYALVAGANRLYIVEVTDPEAPDLVVSFPMADDWGKEVRTFRHCAYVSAESGPGLVIYDLSPLPSSNFNAYPKKEIGNAGGYTTRGHTLHIDTTSAVLYLNDGGWNFSWVFDLFPNPFSPVFAGLYKDLGGIHDGYADNDTLFAAHINQGFVAVVDMHDKSDPAILSTFETPGKFPHNTWLTRDRRHLLAADEISNGFVSIWDIGDLEDIREVSRFRPTPGSGSVPHNAFILNDYAFASWYRDGVILLDVTRPENVVLTGRYDTSPFKGKGFNGSWGNYPYLPSGNILVSDIEEGLFVFTPDFVRACYLEGSVKDAGSKNPLSGVKVFILKGDQVEPALTTAQGIFKTGQSEAGDFDVVFHKDGYRPRIHKVNLKPGETVLLDTELSPLSAPGEDISLLLLSAENNRPLANIKAVVRNEIFQFTIRTDAKGWAKMPVVPSDTFDVFPAFWGRLPRKGVAIDPEKASVLHLERGYYDDFHFDLGWRSEGNAQGGFWERGVLQKIQPFIPGPANDISDDLGDTCYLTDVRTNYGEIKYDVINGTVRLVSPDIDLHDFNYGVLHFNYWQNTSDVTLPFSVYVENEYVKKEIWSNGDYAFNWTPSGEIILPEEIKTGIWQIVFEATDTTAGFDQALLEVGLDVVEIRDGQPTPVSPVEDIRVEIYPNPFHDRLIVRCLLPNGDLPVRWRLFDVAGRQIVSGVIDSEAAVLELKPDIAPGVYFIHVQQDGDSGKTIKVVKI